MNYNNLVFVQGRDPEKLKKALLAIDCPSEVVPGSWVFTGSMHGVWVCLDRPATMVKAKKAQLITNNNYKEV